MTHEEKIKYMEIATGICHFGMHKKHVDQLVQIYDLVIEKKGNADMLDIAKIQAGIEVKYKEKHDSRDSV